MTNNKKSKRNRRRNIKSNEYKYTTSSYSRMSQVGLSANAGYSWPSFYSDYNNWYLNFGGQTEDQVYQQPSSEFSTASSFSSDYVNSNSNYYSFEEPRNPVYQQPSSEFSTASSFNSDYVNSNSNYYSFEEPRNPVAEFEPRYNESHQDRYGPSNSNSHGDFVLTNVTPNSSEYEQVWKYLYGSYYTCFNLFRIENPNLETRFNQRIAELQEAKRGDPDMYYLFHDTQSKNVNSICQNNFDESLGKRFKFGPGVYFSTRPDDAFRRSSYKTDPVRAMFMVEVIADQPVEAKKEEAYPTSDEFDSLVCHDGSTVRKNDKAEYIPRYVALYWRRSVGRYN